MSDPPYAAFWLRCFSSTLSCAAASACEFLVFFMIGRSVTVAAPGSARRTPLAVCRVGAARRGQGGRPARQECALPQASIEAALG
jgi:hypothetical protein